MTGISLGAVMALVAVSPRCILVFRYLCFTYAIRLTIPAGRFRHDVYFVLANKYEKASELNVGRVAQQLASWLAIYDVRSYFVSASPPLINRFLHDLAQLQITLFHPIYNSYLPQHVRVPTYRTRSFHL